MTIDADRRLLAIAASNLQTELVGVSPIELGDDLQRAARDPLGFETRLAGRDRPRLDLAVLPSDFLQGLDGRLHDAESALGLAERNGAGDGHGPPPGEVGMSLAYCQLFIQAIQTGRPSGASFQVCEA